MANIQEKAEESKLDQELPVNNATIELSPIKRRPLQRPKKVRSPLPNQTNIMDLSNPPFKSSTPYILFAEYEPGKTYTQTVKFTNISSYVNCYKILPLSLELEQVSEIIWSPPGKLSGGMAGPEIKIVFKPAFEYNDDLVGELYGQAEFGGNFCVGLECRKKGCQPRIDAVNGDHLDLVKYDENLCNKQVERISKDTCKVNFGANIINGVTLRRIHIVNDGSLESEYNVYTCDEFIASQKVKELPIEIVDVNSKKSTPLADQIKSEKLESFSTANIPGVNKLEETIEAKVEAVLENEASLTKQRQEKSKLFKVSKSAGILSSSGKITIDIQCCPTEFHKQTRKEDFTMTFVVAFKGTDISPIIIECEATLVPSQISTVEEQVDFGMCIAGSIYKKTISVQNKGSRSVKLAVEVGKEHRKYQIKSSNEQQSHDSFFKPSGTHLSIPDVGDIEISPKIGFAQIKDPFSLSINFRPKKLMQNNSTALEPNPKEISVPISLKYKSFGIEMAIPIKINSTITTDSVSFELPKETSSIITDGKTTVDFGTCSMYQSCETAIKIINHSHLIQKVKFTSSSPSLLFDIPGCSKIHSTENDETYYFLDPLISVSALVSFEPSTNKKYSMSLQCSGDSTQHFKIVFKGESLRPLLKFENNEITFSPTSLGSYSTIKTFLLRDNNKHNGLKADAKIGFRFEEPKIIGLSVKDTDGKTKDIDLSLVEGQEGVKFQQPASMTKIAKPPVERMSTGRKLSDNPIQIEAESSANGNTNQPYHYSKTLPIPVEISPKTGFVKIHEKYPIDIKISPKLDLEEVKRAIITRLEKLKTNERAYNQACDEAQKREVEKKEKGIIASKEKKGAAAKKKENKPIEQVEEVALLPPVKELDPPINYFEDFQDTTITILVPCFIRIEKSENDRMALLLGAVPDEAEEEVQVPLICLKLIVPITSPSFVIVSLENRHPLKNSFDVQEEQTDDITSLLKQAKVDFGQVPIGQKLIQIVKLRNTLTSPITLHSNILNPQGPFYLVKALRQIPPLQAYDLKLSFEPAKPGKLKTQYTIYTEETQVLLELAGEGVSPMMQLKLKIDMDEVDGDTIRFGDVPIGELNEKTFVLRNPCHFPILCGFQVSTKSYKISPEEVIIQPYAKQDISVTFCPYSEDDCINDNVQLKYWGQSEIQGLRLLGRGWETTSAVVGYDDPIPVIADDIKEIEVAEEVLDTETEEPKIDESRQRSASTVSRKSEVKSSLKYVTVACDWSKHEEAEEVFWSVLAKEIGIANLKVTTKDKKIGGKQPPVSFTIEKINNLEFDIDPESGKLQVREKEVNEEDTSLPHFEMEPMSGTVEVGSTKPITIKCVVGAAQIEKKEVPNKKKQVCVVNTSSGREKVKEATQVVGYFRVALKGGFNLERKMVSNEKREWIVKVYTRTK